MVITSPPDSPQSSPHIPPNLANSKSPHDPNASKFLSKLHSVLKNLKPTQESIHTNSKWFLQATAAQNTSLIKPAASLWKSCWDECRGNSNWENFLHKCISLYAYILFKSAIFALIWLTMSK